MVDCSLLWLGNSVTPRGMALKQGLEANRQVTTSMKCVPPQATMNRPKRGNPLERHIPAPFIARYASVADMAT